jgi:hypothetical protein
LPKSLAIFSWMSTTIQKRPSQNLKALCVCHSCLRDAENATVGDAEVPECKEEVSADDSALAKETEATDPQKGEEAESKEEGTIEEDKEAAVDTTEEKATNEESKSDSATKPGVEAEIDDSAAKTGAEAENDKVADEGGDSIGVDEDAKAEAEKLAKRQARFGVVETQKATPTVQPSGKEEEKKSEDAKPSIATAAANAGETEDKLLARQKRFGTVVEPLKHTTARGVKRPSDGGGGGKGKGKGKGQGNVWKRPRY